MYVIRNMTKRDELMTEIGHNINPAYGVLTYHPTKEYHNGEYSLKSEAEAVKDSYIGDDRLEVVEKWW